jgi:plastocyanin
MPSPRLLAALMSLSLMGPATAQNVPVTGRAVVQHAKPGGDNAGVAVWLLPLDQTLPLNAQGKRFQLVQKDKKFEPHLLIVPVGAMVEFPNRDPFFHNVFSLYDGRRFDLGLYEAGSSRSVQFNRAGVSYVFCNIHPQMSAVVISVSTPFYTITGKDGRFSFPDVPPGRYRLKVWYERALPEKLAGLAREVTVAAGQRDLSEVTVAEEASLPVPHKNKYGREYDNTSSPYGPVR